MAVGVQQMDRYLDRISSWANRGTLAQFRAEIEAKLVGSEYCVEEDGEALRFYRNRTEGGFLGIGRKTIKEPVLEILRSNGAYDVMAEPRDIEFVQYLGRALQQH